MNSLLNAFHCACQNSRVAFSAFGADEFEPTYNWSAVSFDPPAEGSRGAIFYSDSQAWQIRDALGKLFREKTNKYFKTADNKMWDLIIYHDPAQINQKLGYLVWNGGAITPQPLATVSNLRYIKQTLLADWRGNRIWYAYIPESQVQMATPDNLKNGRPYKSKTGATMTRTQVLNLLKRNDPKYGMAPAKLGVHPLSPGTRENPNCGTGTMGDNVPESMRCSYDKLVATRKRYSGINGFAGLFDQSYLDRSAYDESYYDNADANYAAGDDIRSQFSNNQLLNAQDQPSYDDRTGYYIDRAVNLAFDVAGNVIGDWNGREVVNGSGRRIAPPASSGSLPLIIGGGVLLAVLMSKK